MGRPIHKLTAKGVEKIIRAVRKTGPKTKTRFYGDGGGLALVARPGSVAWLFRYSFKGRARSMGLGPATFPDEERPDLVTLAEAREAAMEARISLKNGQDPLAARREVEEVPTFREAAIRYVDTVKAAEIGPKALRDWRNSLDLYVYPVLGDLPVSEVGIPDVLRVFRRDVKALDRKGKPTGEVYQLWRDRPETARRVRMRIESILDAVAVDGHREGENPARWREVLAHKLPRHTAKPEPHPSMPWREVPDFYRRLRGVDSTPARALALIVLTAARSGEARAARWSEFDLENRVWEIPDEKMKAGVRHVVPIADEAAAILEEMGPGEPDGLVFPTPTGRVYGDAKLGDVLVDLGWERGTASTHGFRSTFSVWAQERTGVAEEVISKALAHRIKDAADRSYLRSNHLEKRRALSAAWSEFVVNGEAETSAEVISIGSAAS